MLQVYIHALSREADSARMIGVCGLSTSLTDYEKKQSLLIKPICCVDAFPFGAWGRGQPSYTAAVLLQRLPPPAVSRVGRFISHRAMAPKGHQEDSKAVLVLKQQLKDMKASRNEHKERADALGRFAKVIANKVEANKHVREIFDDVRKLYRLTHVASTQTKPTSLGRLQKLSELPEVVEAMDTAPHGGSSSSEEGGSSAES